MDTIIRKGGGIEKKKVLNKESIKVCDSDCFILPFLTLDVVRRLSLNQDALRNLRLGLPNRFYRGADKSLARPTSRCILFDGENISFDASLVIYK